MEGVGTGSLAAAALHADFDLEELAPWKEGSPVPFAFLAAAFEAIGSDSKRLAKTQQLVNMFRAILGRTPQDLLPTVYLCTNQVAPSHEGTELGIGDAILIKVRPLAQDLLSCRRCVLCPLRRLPQLHGWSACVSTSGGCKVVEWEEQWIDAGLHSAC